MDELGAVLRRHRRGRRRRLRLAQARHRRHPRRQRRRDRAAASSSRRSVGAEVRFIEYMDVGGATRWTPDGGRLAPRDARADRGALRRRVLPLDEASSAPADRFVLPDGTTFGIISSTTEPFCASCDRSRLTADGVWLLCLYAATGTDLRRPLRAGATREDLQRLDSRPCGRCAPIAAPRSVSAWIARRRSFRSGRSRRTRTSRCTRAAGRFKPASFTVEMHDRRLARRIEESKIRRQRITLWLQDRACAVARRPSWPASCSQLSERLRRGKTPRALGLCQAPSRWAIFRGRL